MNSLIQLQNTSMKINSNELVNSVTEYFYENKF